MIKRSAKKRNPHDSGLITTQIKSKGNSFQVLAFVGPTPLLTVDNIKSRFAAEKAADVARKTLEKELKSAKRKNPGYELEPSLQKAVGKAIALPDDKMEAFELGRLYGIQTSIAKYCGAFNFFERRKALKAVDNAIRNSLGNLAKTILVRGEGFEGPVPFVKKSSKSS